MIGLTFGVAYTVIAALIFGIRGNAPFAANGTNVGALMLLYIVGCSASGFVVGLLIRVARRSSVLGGVVGIIAIAPFCFAAIALTDYQRGRWNSDDTIAAVIMSVAFGIAGAHLFRKKPIVW